MRAYKYIVNEKKRTVVCLVYVKDEPFVNSSGDSIVFRGVAKCGINDEFSVDFGKELAKKRALVGLTRFELCGIDREYSDVYVDCVRREYVKMVSTLDRKDYLKSKITSLNREINEMVCPY